MRHDEARTRTGAAVLIAWAVIYAAGNVLPTRPYVSRPGTLFLAVPAAAMSGMVVLGVLALVAAVLVAVLADPPAPDIGMGGSRGRRVRRPRR